MRKVFQVAGLVGLVLMLGGCASTKQFLYQDYAPPPIKSGLHTKNESGSHIANELRDVLIQDGDVADGCFNPKTGNPDEWSCRGQRNAAVAGLMTISDELCVQHARTIFGNEAAYNLTFGTLTNLFAGASTVAGTQGAKTLFSGIALFSSAERSLINEAVYKTTLVTSISKKIREGREQRRSKILKRMRDEDMMQFTMWEALDVVQDYHGTCSFMYGLERALEEGNQSGFEKRKLTLKAELSELESKREMLRATKVKDEDREVTAIVDRIVKLHKEIADLETTQSDNPSTGNTNGEKNSGGQP